MLINFIKRYNLCGRIESKYIRTFMYRFLSPCNYSYTKKIKAFITKYLKGNVLDIGAGRLTWKSEIEKLCDKYTACDITIDSNELDLVSNAEFSPIKDNMFDSVICCQVIEHTKRPQALINESVRVLKPGGLGIFTFPLFGCIHGEPHDYYRYTKYGFQFLCPDNVETVTIEEQCGILGFVTSYLMYFLFAIFGNIPLIKYITTPPLMLLTLIFYKLDNVFGMKSTFPTNYFVVFRKKH